MIDTILWDIDGTLLDFAASEAAAIRSCFAFFGLGECDEAMLARYSAINRWHWEQLEAGKQTKPEVLVGRFGQFFKQEGITGCPPETFNARYQQQLGEEVFWVKGGLELVQALQGSVRQYAVTNGTRTAQRKKLRKSGLDALLDGIFISDEIGAEKPNIGFFDAVFRQIAPLDKEKTLIVGDSLTSDMKGGRNAGIVCCWYNPHGLPLPEGISLQYQIQALSQIKEIL